MESNSISFKDLFRIVRRFWILLLAVTIVGGLLGFCYASATLDPMYSASVQLKVHNYTNKDDTFVNTNSEFELAEKLKAGYILTVTESYDYLNNVVLSLSQWRIDKTEYDRLAANGCKNLWIEENFPVEIKEFIGYVDTGKKTTVDGKETPVYEKAYETRIEYETAYFINVLEEFGYINDKGVITLTPSAIRSMVSITEDEDATNFFKIAVRSPNKEFSLYLTKALSRVLIEDFVDLGSVTENSAPRASDGAYYPVTKYAVIGAAAALVLCYIVLLLVKLFNTKINTEDDLKRISELPLLATIPDFNFGKRK